MTNEIKPLTALILVTVFALLLIGKFWAHGEAISVRLFSYMHAQPNGNSCILLGNQLFCFDLTGTFSEKIDLSALGVEDQASTDFAFFGNGDLLLRRHRSENDFIYRLQRYRRLTNRRDVVSDNPVDGLFRCNRSACKPFSTPPLSLNDAFALTIDPKSDRVFISDASRHQVYLFSGSGSKLDSARLFMFPNQIEYRDGKLYVADTNHHRLVVLEAEGNHFGQIVQSIDTRQGPAFGTREVWPSGFLLTAGRFWIHNAVNDMSHGGIYLFDEKGDFMERLKLPKDADPFYLLQMGNEVLMSDFSNDRIYRSDLDGKLLGEFFPEVFRPYWITLIERKRLFEALDLAFTGLFAFGLALGFGFVIIQNRKHEPAIPTAIVSNSRQGLAIAKPIHWIFPRRLFKIIVVLFCGFNVMLLGMVWLVYFVEGIGFLGFLTQNYSVIALVLIAVVFAALQLRRKIGVAEDALYFVGPLGGMESCLKQDIIFSDTIILFGKTVRNVRGLMNAYPPAEVESGGRITIVSDDQTRPGSPTR